MDRSFTVKQYRPFSKSGGTVKALPDSRPEEDAAPMACRPNWEWSGAVVGLSVVVEGWKGGGRKAVVDEHLANVIIITNLFAT